MSIGPPRLRKGKGLLMSHRRSSDACGQSRWNWNHCSWKGLVMLEVLLTLALLEEVLVLLRVQLLLILLTMLLRHWLTHG